MQYSLADVLSITFPEPRIIKTPTRMPGKNQRSIFFFTHDLLWHSIYKIKSSPEKVNINFGNKG